MLDEETVEYGVCLILAGLVERMLSPAWDEGFRQSKEPFVALPYDGSFWIDGRPWMSLR